MQVDESSSSSNISVVDDGAPSGLLQARTFKQLDCLRWTTRVFVIAGLVAFVVTIVLIGLTQARMIPPLSPMFAFSGVVAIIVVAAILHCIQKSIAKNASIDYTAYLDQREPPDPKENKKKKKT